MKKNGMILKVFLYVTLVGLGVLLGIVIRHYNTLPLSAEINLIDVAAIIVSIFLAVYIPAVLNRQLQTTRDKKELLESRIEDYQSLIRRVNILVQDMQTRPFDAHLTITNLLDIADHRLRTLSSLLNKSELRPEMNREMDELRRLDGEHKALLWGKVNVEDGDSSVDQEIRMKEEALYNQLDEASSLLMFKINNAK